MLVDCFLGFNELELAKFRIKYLCSEVDSTLIAEANISHSGNSKPLYFTKLKKQFPRIFARVEVLVLDLGSYADSWEREVSSREQLIKYAVTRFPNAKYVLSDLDEIPSLQQLRNFKMCKGNFHYVTPTTYRYANWSLTDRHMTWNKGVLGDSSLVNLTNGGRMLKLPNLDCSDVGIHASYLKLNEEFISSKMQGFAHVELNNRLLFDKKTIEFCDRYQIDHLGRFDRRGFGLLEVVPHKDLRPIQQELFNHADDWFSFRQCGASFYKRLVASLIIYSMIKCTLHQRELFSHFLKDEKVSFKTKIRLIYCLINNAIEANSYRAKDTIKGILKSKFARLLFLRNAKKRLYPF